MPETSYAPPSRQQNHVRSLSIRSFSLCFIGLFLIAAECGAAGLLVADGGSAGLLELKEQVVDVTINNGIAVTRVEQTFTNTEDRVVEALYTFPVPNGASVSNFSMWINGKEMIGEVVEKEQARRIYNNYKRRNIDPGLLEQVDYKTFEMRIFPIAAGADQRVRFTYYQQLELDHDRANYVYPLATVSRRNVRQRTEGRHSLTMKVLSKVPIITVDSPSHGDAFVVSSHTPEFAEASFEAEGGDLSRDFVLSYQTSRANTGVDVVTSQPPGEDGYFMMTVTAGDELQVTDEAMDYVFVLDISGSMANSGKLGVSREAIAHFIEALSPEDRFEVLTFNTSLSRLFGNLSQAAADSLADARKFLGSQRARGGTQLMPAMNLAYQYGDPDRPLNVVVLSDGMTEQRELQQLLELIQQRPANAKVFAIGVGNEVNRPLLSQMADEAGGLSAFISQGDDFQRQAKAFRRKLTRPAATDVKLSIAGVDAYDLVPVRLPNLHHGTPVRVYGRYRGNGSFKVNVDAAVQGQPIAISESVVPAVRQNPEIERMWAYSQIQEMLREADRSGSRSAVRDQIVRLGEDFSIATEYTSFLVLENNNEYKRWKIKRRNRSRTGRDRVGQEALRKELDQLRAESFSKLGPGKESGSVASNQPKYEKIAVDTSNTTHNTPEPSSGLMLILTLGPLFHVLRQRRAGR